MNESDIRVQSDNRRLEVLVLQIEQGEIWHFYKMDFFLSIANHNFMCGHKFGIICSII